MVFLGGIWYYVGNYSNILRELKTINDAGFGESVISVFSIPNVAVLGIAKNSLDQPLTIQDLDDTSIDWGTWIIDTVSSNGREVTLTSTPTTLNGYTPRNAKLRQYPYCYLGFTPSNSSQKIFRYEDFTNGTPIFNIKSEINPNPNCYFIPKNYKGITGNNVSESVAVTGYPNISYKTDFFNNWIAQNSNMINLNLERNQFNYEMGISKDTANYMGKQIGNAMSGNLLGFGMDSANVLMDTYSATKNHDYDIKQQMLQIEKQQMLPNSASMGGSNATLLGYGLMNDDIFTRYTIKYQFAERIDKYFDMYGYQTNMLKIPNLNNRPNWNYVKTLGINILPKTTSSVPQEDLQEYKFIFDNGVTLWHNPATFLDYSQNNRTS